MVHEHNMNTLRCAVKCFFYPRLNTVVCSTKADWHQGNRSCQWETGGRGGERAWETGGDPGGRRGVWNEPKWEGPGPTETLSTPVTRKFGFSYEQSIPSERRCRSRTIEYAASAATAQATILSSSGSAGTARGVAQWRVRNALTKTLGSKTALIMTGRATHRAADGVNFVDDFPLLQT